MRTAIIRRLTALEATRPAPAIDRAAGLAEAIARAEAMLAGTPWPPGPPSTNPDVIAHKARLIAAIMRTDDDNIKTD
jgi:hypothetical protein